MKIFDCIQGSDEWYAARCGIPTSSNFDKIITSKGVSSKQRDKHLWKLAGERIVGISEAGYKSGAMQEGQIKEEEARETYEFITGKTVTQVGFCLAEGEYRYGASPDGLVGDGGLLEIKCPIISTHVFYLLTNVMPIDYVQQVQGQLLVTDRKWCDFMSYYPGMKPLIIRVERDNTFLISLEVELNSFVKELEIITNKIRG